jgi:hypothetical protein
MEMTLEVLCGGDAVARIAGSLASLRGGEPGT